MTSGAPRTRLLLAVAVVSGGLAGLAAPSAARVSARVFYLDAKGDERNAARFHALMQLAGRRCTVFPRAAFDGWRGQPRDLQNRLLEIAGLPSALRKNQSG